MSVLLQAEIVNVVVLAAVLQADLGSHRKIGTHRIVRPILLAAGIVPIFIEKVSTHGGGLLVELAGATAGAVAGLIALALLHVCRSPATGKAVTRAGWAYGVLWAGIIAARGAFSYGADHWFNAQIGQWLVINKISSGAITDGLIFMAVAMILTRTVGLAVRARSVTSPSLASASSRLDTRAAQIAVGSAAGRSN